MWFRSGTLGFSTDTFAFNYGLAIGTTSMANGTRLAVGPNITATDTTISAPVGNFTTLSGSLTGTISTATRATTVDTVQRSTSATHYLTFVTDDNATATAESLYTDAGISYNPSTNALTVPTVNVENLKANDGTNAITITNSTGAVGFANSVTINGNLYVIGTATEVETTNLKVQDNLIDLGLIQSGSLVPPSSDLNIDLGILFNWYNGSAKKSAVYWDDSVQRVGIASDVTEVTGVLTANAYAAVEIGSLWVTDCSGTSQVISCTGAERFLNNITVDAGEF
jgi:hypothetical protein